jgi:hypothetical protein
LFNVCLVNGTFMMWENQPTAKPAGFAGQPTGVSGIARRE